VRSDTAPITAENAAAIRIAEPKPIQPSTMPPVDHHADRVGTHADEGRVAERYEAAVAEDQVEAGGGDCEDADAARRTDVELLTQSGRKKRKRHQERRHQRKRDANGKRRCRLRHPRAGKSPCGRMKRTIAISR
jgi:hypothetical protein